MKIKSDFVTNSSSTCFVVFVPNKYVPSDDVLITTINKEMQLWDFDEDDNDNIETAEQFLEVYREELMETIESLKNGDEVYKEEYGDGIDYRIYSTIDSLMSNEGFGLTGVEMGSGGMDCLCGVSEEKILKILGENLEFTDFCNNITRSDNEKQ